MLLGRICKFVYLIADCITFDLNGMYCSKTAQPYDLISCADLNLVPVDNADYYYDGGLSPEGSTDTLNFGHVVQPWLPFRRHKGRICFKEHTKAWRWCPRRTRRVMQQYNYKTWRADRNRFTLPNTAVKFMDHVPHVLYLRDPSDSQCMTSKSSYVTQRRISAQSLFFFSVVTHMISDYVASPSCTICTCFPFCLTHDACDWTMCHYGTIHISHGTIHIPRYLSYCFSEPHRKKVTRTRLSAMRLKSVN